MKLPTVAWMGCFVGLIALMRFETNFADANRGYKSRRGWLRVVLAFIGMLWCAVRSQGNSVDVAFIPSFAAIFFLVLRSKCFVWHTLQHTGWMRARVELPLTGAQARAAGAARRCEVGRLSRAPLQAPSTVHNDEKLGIKTGSPPPPDKCVR